MSEDALLLVHTGPGKGKSTSAFGMALRAWNQGWPVGVFQFVKSGRWHPGEEAAFRALGAVHEQTGQGGPVTWESMGAGFTWLPVRPGRDHAEMAAAGWQRVRDLITSGEHRLLVLDEFTYVLNNGWVSLAEALDVLARRACHVVITGRNCPDALAEAADLVTTMEATKHPYQQGIKGQAGIEW